LSCTPLSRGPVESIGNDSGLGLEKGLEETGSVVWNKKLSGGEDENNAGTGPTSSFIVGWIPWAWGCVDGVEAERAWLL